MPSKGCLLLFMLIYTIINTNKGRKKIMNLKLPFMWSAQRLSLLMYVLGLVMQNCTFLHKRWRFGMSL